MFSRLLLVKSGSIPAPPLQIAASGSSVSSGSGAITLPAHLAISASGASISAGSGAISLKATDGFTQKIEWASSAGKLVMSGYRNNGGNRVGPSICTSTDGINWTIAASDPWFVQSIVNGGFAWSPTLNLWIALSNTVNDNSLMTSPDGSTWTKRTVTGPPASDFFNFGGCAWSSTAGRFVAIGGVNPSTDGTGPAFYSSDGTSWTEASDNPGPVLINHQYWSSSDSVSNVGHTVAWCDTLGFFVTIADRVVSGATNRISTSPDGDVWTDRSTPWDYNGSFDSSSFQGMWSGMCITWAHDLGLIVAGSGGSHSGADHRYSVMTSTDAVTWNQYDPSSGAGNWTFSSIAWAPSPINLLVAVGSFGGSSFIATSPNGSTWTTRSIPWSNGVVHDVVWADTLGMLLVTGYDYNGFNQGTNTLLTSTDGINWTSRHTPFDRS